MPLILLTFSVLKLEIFKDVNELHLKKVKLKNLTSEVIKWEASISSISEHSQNRHL